METCALGSATAQAHCQRAFQSKAHCLPPSHWKRARRQVICAVLERRDAATVQKEKPDWTGDKLMSRMVNAAIANKYMYGLMKVMAKNVMKSTAEANGIPWGDIVRQYQNTPEVFAIKEELEVRDMDYPQYYLQPFHAYEEGNLNWLAAFEVESATASMALRTFAKQKLAPEAAQDLLRANIHARIQEFREEVGARPVEAILDEGCSVGISTTYLAAAFPDAHVTGLDLSPNFLAVAEYKRRMVSSFKAVAAAEDFAENHRVQCVEEFEDLIAYLGHGRGPSHPGPPTMNGAPSLERSPGPAGGGPAPAMPGVLPQPQFFLARAPWVPGAHGPLGTSSAPGCQGPFWTCSALRTPHGAARNCWAPRVPKGLGWTVSKGPSLGQDLGEGGMLRPPVASSALQKGITADCMMWWVTQSYQQDPGLGVNINSTRLLNSNSHNIMMRMMSRPPHGRWASPPSIPGKLFRVIGLF
eukprot:jgi/Botrbrau1/3555/Bobra.0078s0012.1